MDTRTNEYSKKFIHKPLELKDGNSIVGTKYPLPIVVHEQARAKALKAFQNI